MDDADDLKQLVLHVIRGAYVLAEEGLHRRHLDDTVATVAAPLIARALADQSPTQIRELLMSQKNGQ